MRLLGARDVEELVPEMVSFCFRFLFSFHFPMPFPPIYLISFSLGYVPLPFTIEQMAFDACLPDTQHASHAVGCWIYRSQPAGQPQCRRRDRCCVGVACQPTVQCAEDNAGDRWERMIARPVKFALAARSDVFSSSLEIFGFGIARRMVSSAVGGLILNLPIPLHFFREHHAWLICCLVTLLTYGLGGTCRFPSSISSETLTGLYVCMRMAEDGWCDHLSKIGFKRCIVWRMA